MTELNADNLEIDYSEKGLRIEPSYLSYLRTHDYILDEIKSVHTVKRDRSDTAHMVVELVTYDYPRDHPELDYVAHRTRLKVCDCWSWRNSSADVGEGAKPSECGSCVHVQEAFKSEKAKNDDSQTRLK